MKGSKVKQTVEELMAKHGDATGKGKYCKPFGSKPQHRCLLFVYRFGAELPGMGSVKWPDVHPSGHTSGRVGHQDFDSGGFRHPATPQPAKVPTKSNHPPLSPAT